MEMRPYREPRPPRAGHPYPSAPHLVRAVHEFLQHASDVRAAILNRAEREPSRKPVMPIERLCGHALKSSLRLLGATHAVHIRPSGRAERVGASSSFEVDEDIKVNIQAIEERRRLRREASDGVFRPPGPPSDARGAAAARAERRPAGPPSLWYDGVRIYARYELACEDAGFFVVDKAGLTDEDIYLFGAFLRIIQEQITVAEALELAQDQRQLLHRRTITAQLRPNDLLYRTLKRLRRHVPWTRSAFVLAPAADGGADRREWFIAAERLSQAVEHKSGRVGARFGLDGPEAPAGAKDDKPVRPRDFVVPDLSHWDPESATPWERMICACAMETGGLPRDLRSPRSLLALELPAGGDDTQGSRYALVLTDATLGRYRARHLEVARRFVSDVGYLLATSARVSRRLVSLWVPEGVEPPAHEPDADAPEILDSRACAPDTPAVLGVDAIQVVQLRRGAIRRAVAGAISVLTVLKLPRGDGEDPVDLVEGRASFSVEPTAELLWGTLTTGTERTAKNADGVDPRTVANLFRPGREKQSIRTVLVVPIRSGGEVSGALLAYRLQPSAFVDIDKLLLRSLSARFGELIESHRRLADRSRLVECLAQIAAAPSLDEARSRLVEGARELLQADHAFMMASTENGVPRETRSLDDALEDIAHTWQDEEMFVPRLRVRGNRHGICGKVYVEGMAVVASDVAQQPDFVPLYRRDESGSETPVPTASELAVPIIVRRSPRSADPAPFGAASPGVIGVLDGVWRERHEITARDLDTMSALAGHAAAVLELTSSLRQVQHMRDGLRSLVDAGRELQVAHSDLEIMRCITRRLAQVVDCDIVGLFKHLRGAKQLELVDRAGPLGDELKGAEEDPVPVAESWVGGFLASFRRGAEKSAVDRYDRKAGGWKIPGTRTEKSEARLACGISPTWPAADPHVVWVILLWRVRPSNFGEDDRLLVTLAAEDCEAAMRRLASEQEEKRSLELAVETRKVALDLVDRVRARPAEVYDDIVRRIRSELGASYVCVLGYDSDLRRYDMPPQALPRFAGEGGAAPPRKDGISEAIRATLKLVVIEDVADPPRELASAVASSSFLQRHREVRSVIGAPMFTRSEDEPDQVPKFSGVMYVDFAEPRAPSPAECEFLQAMLRFLAECGGIGPRLALMRQTALERVQKLQDPMGVFRQILDVAVESLCQDIPAAVRNPSFRLGGQVIMITHWSDRPQLIFRASFGEATGAYPAMLDIHEGITGSVVKSGQAVRIDDITPEVAQESGYVPYLKDMRSELAVPILLPGTDIPGVHPNVIGVINIEASEPQAFTQRHQKLLIAFADQPVSHLLHLAERHHQLLGETKHENDQFVFDVAHLVVHDVTKPLRNMGAWVRSIRAALSDGASQKVEPTLCKMEEASKRSEDLLRTGLMHLTRPVLDDLNPMNVIETVEQWAESRDHPPVRVAKPPVDDFSIRKGHRDLLASILQNLYENSVDAFARDGAPRGGARIEIEFRHDPELRILDVLFKDNGPGLGVPMAEWEQLFRPLSSLRHPGSQQDKTRKGGGWGLGLPMIRQMMYVMDSKVNVTDSDPSRGTTFLLRFEARDASQEV